ncbi:Lipopolysaccharide-modifying protein, partial [Penicillium cinerascens]
DWIASPYHEVRRRIAAIDQGEIAPDGSFLPDKKKQLVWRSSLAPLCALNYSSRLLGRAGLACVLLTEMMRTIFDLIFLLLKIIAGKYLLNCRSVFISHPLVWKEAHHAALVLSGPEANYIEVDQGFTDLSCKIAYLIDKSRDAERTANNAVRTFRDRYLTPAAE